MRMTEVPAQEPGERFPYPRRVYPLDPRALTEEQIAVAFAMTSRRPEPFDEIAQQVSEATAADFHERWVLGYGHASVAEHAVVHLAVENISRLACGRVGGQPAGFLHRKVVALPGDGAKGISTSLRNWMATRHSVGNMSPPASACSISTTSSSTAAWNTCAV